MKFSAILSIATAVAVGTAAVSAAPVEGLNKRSNSGQATWYRQDGTTGSCGQTHSDSDKVIAVPQYMSGQHCGQKITLQRGSKKTTAVVADTCPECEGNHLDLSRGAFEALGSFEEGEIPINWWFDN